MYKVYSGKHWVVEDEVSSRNTLVSQERFHCSFCDYESK